MESVKPVFCDEWSALDESLWETLKNRREAVVTEQQSNDAKLRAAMLTMRGEKGWFSEAEVDAFKKNAAVLVEALLPFLPRSVIDGAVPVLQKPSDSWFQWLGAKVNTHKHDTMVEVRLRDGTVTRGRVGSFSWSWVVGRGDFDIVAYRFI